MLKMIDKLSDYLTTDVQRHLIRNPWIHNQTHRAFERDHKAKRCVRGVFFIETLDRMYHLGPFRMASAGR